MVSCVFKLEETIHPRGTIQLTAMVIKKRWISVLMMILLAL
jgi:hypothetical protein